MKMNGAKIASVLDHFTGAHRKTIVGRAIQHGSMQGAITMGLPAAATAELFDDQPGIQWGRDLAFIGAGAATGALAGHITMRNNTSLVDKSHGALDAVSNYLRNNPESWERSDLSSVFNSHFK